MPGDAAGDAAGRLACHTVDTTAFELSSNSRNRAWSDEDELAEIVRAELMPILEQVLDEIDPGSGVIEVGNLEIDLGALVLEGGWSNVRQRLHDELHTALKNARTSSGNDQLSEPQRHSSGDRSAADFESSRHYLRFGLLPRDIRILQRPEMERRLIEAARSEPDLFIALMRDTAAGHGVINRLILQYPDLFLGRLAEALDPLSGASMAEFAGWLKKAISAITNGAMPADEVRGQVWSRVLGDLASHSSGAVAARGKKIVEALARDLTCPRSELLGHLSRLIPVSSDLAPLIREQWRLADRGAASPEEQASDVTDPVELERSGTPAIDLDRLLHELDQGRPGAAGRLLDSLEADAVAISAIPRGLGVAAYRLLLEEVLHRTGGDGDLTPFLHAVARHAQRSGDEPSFYHAVFEQLLRKEPVDLESIDLEVAQPDVAQAAGKAPTDRNAGVTPGSVPLGATGDLIRAYDLFAFLTRTGSETAPPVDLNPQGHGDWIAELARLSPALLQRLLLELRNGVMTVPRLCASLGAAELRALVRVLVPPGTRCNEVDCRRLLQAIDRHAGEAGNQRTFYQQVLQRLADRDLIDLEAIASESANHLEQPAIGSRSIDPDHGLDANAGEGSRDEPRERIRQTFDPSHSAASAEELGQTLDALKDYLLGGAHSPGIGTEDFRRVLEQVIATSPESAFGLLQGLAAKQAAPGRLVKLLPEWLLTRLLQVLAPSVYDSILRAADTVANACYDLAGGWQPERVNELKWRYCIQSLLGSDVTRNIPLFVRGLVDYLAQHSDYGDGAQLYRQLHQSSVEMDPGSVSLFAPDERRDPAFAKVASSGRQQMDDDRASLESFEAEYLEVLAQGIAVGNAGLVLTSPYLPRLFDLLGLRDKGSFRNTRSQERAVQLLQYLVDESNDAPDYSLVLNKVLCGLDVKHPVQATIELKDSEKEAMEGLLKGMIEHWKVLKSTSVSGLREAFLQRDGMLRHDQDGWRLSVEPKAYDMLLDQIPWSYSIIRHPWMEEVVHVDWR